MRVNVVGTSGSGKSTFAKRLAKATGVSYIEMDVLHWKPNWQESSDEALETKLKAAIHYGDTESKWILDGNYKRTIPIKWQYATHVIWLDYSLSRTLYQAIKRAFKRAISKKEIWPNTGNVETFKQLFLSRDSMILWTLKTYHQNRKKYQALMQDPKFSHIEFICLNNPSQAADLISTFQHRVN